MAKSLGTIATGEVSNDNSTWLKIGKVKKLTQRQKTTLSIARTMMITVIRVIWWAIKLSILP